MDKRRRTEFLLGGWWSWISSEITPLQTIERVLYLLMFIDPSNNDIIHGGSSQICISVFPRMTSLLKGLYNIHAMHTSDEIVFTWNILLKWPQLMFLFLISSWDHRVFARNGGWKYGKMELLTLCLLTLGMALEVYIISLAIHFFADSWCSLKGWLAGFSEIKY